MHTPKINQHCGPHSHTLDTNYPTMDCPTFVYHSKGGPICFYAIFCDLLGKSGKWGRPHLEVCPQIPCYLHTHTSLFSGIYKRIHPKTPHTYLWHTYTKLWNQTCTWQNLTSHSPVTVPEINSSFISHETITLECIVVGKSGCSYLSSNTT